MQDVCSCGTQLVEGAIFCHRCGKAQRELLEPEPLAEAVDTTVASASTITTPPQTSPLKAMPVSFHNIVAVRIGLLVASVASMLDALPFIDMLCILWSAVAGFAAVWLYRRSTGQALSVRGGAKMGWITGVLNSVIVIVLLTLTFAASVTEFTAQYHQQLTAMAAHDANYAKAMPLLESPYTLATGVIFILFLLFLVFTGACVAGGALGARFTRKDSPPA